jgi:hypothetical protein
MDLFVRRGVYRILCHLARNSFLADRKHDSALLQVVLLTTCHFLAAIVQSQPSL